MGHRDCFFGQGHRLVVFKYKQHNYDVSAQQYMMTQHNYDDSAQLWWLNTTVYDDSTQLWWLNTAPSCSYTSSTLIRVETVTRPEPLFIIRNLFGGPLPTTLFSQSKNDAQPVSLPYRGVCGSTSMPLDGNQPLAVRSGLYGESWYLKSLCLTCVDLCFDNCWICVWITIWKYSS